MLLTKSTYQQLLGPSFAGPGAEGETIAQSRYRQATKEVVGGLWRRI
jgi:hypothetical protein